MNGAAVADYRHVVGEDDFADDRDGATNEDADVARPKSFEEVCVYAVGVGIVRHVLVLGVDQGENVSELDSSENSRAGLPRDRGYEMGGIPTSLVESAWVAYRDLARSGDRS